MSSAPSLMPAAAPPAGQAAEHLKVKLRPDLIVQPQFYEGMTHYVIKDPIALKYFRFKVEEYFLLQQFNGHNNLQDVKRLFERKYRPQTISIEDLIRFAAQLHEAGIAQIDSPDQAAALIKRRSKRRWKEVQQFLANIMYLKIPIADPERLLTWMLPYFRWIYTPWFVTFSVGMMLAALTLVASQYSTFAAKLPEFQSFFNTSTIIYFWVSLAIIKIIHEFGHGLTAKYYGGEVHEMGMLFLVMTPALYCDVTDSWLLPNKWHRIWISFAGIYVECFLASLATFVWFYSEPGLLNSLMLATMFICSVNTIMFNANPLLRYDGYYVAADYLEIPNLRIKSTQFFTYLFQDKILGLEVPVQSYMPKSRRVLFVVYAIASYLYRWVVTFSILFFLYKFLPERLRVVSAMLALGSLVPLIAMPAYQMIKFVRTPGRMRKVKKVRATAFAVACIVITAAILAIPTPLRVQGTLVLTPAQPEKIYAEVPGRLVSLDVKDGDFVKQGDTIARLSNPEKMLQFLDLQQQQSAYFAIARHFSVRSDPDFRALTVQNDNAARDLEPAINKISDQISKLNLIAGRDGVVMGVPHKETEGQWVKPGKAFCEIGDPKKLEAHLIIDQSDIDLVKQDRRAWVKVYGHSEKTYNSTVVNVAKRNRDEIPPELSNNAGGEIATKQDEKTGQVKPLNAVYEVVLAIDNEDLELQPGLRGFAKIDGGTHTLAWWAWRSLSKTFHFLL